MQLLSSWKDSLSIFKPANFKLFCLVTLKSLMETYKVWFKYWGWLIGTFFIIEYFWPQFPVTTGLDFFAMGPINILNMFPLVFSPLLLIKYCLVLLVVFTLVLSARPSTLKKSFSYFAEYGVCLFYILFWFLLLPLLWIGIFKGVHFIIPAFQYDQVIFFILYFLYAVTSLLFMLFLLDSDGSIGSALKALLQSLKMYLYNFPFYLITLTMMVLFYIIVGLGLSFVAKYTDNWNLAIYNFGGVIFNILLFMPLLVCIITNFYIKRVHEQFQLYYGNHIKE